MVCVFGAMHITKTNTSPSVFLSSKLYIDPVWGVAKLVRHGTLDPAFLGSNPSAPVFEKNR